MLTASPFPSLTAQQPTTAPNNMVPVVTTAATTSSLPLASANSNFFYTPIYQHYFGLSPPNPSLNNTRLLEDHIDWYMSVYLEEELSFQWLNVGTGEERRRRRGDEEEAHEELQRLISASTKTP